MVWKSRLRHFLIQLYFMCRLYIHGFLEMFIQLFREVSLNDTIGEVPLEGRIAFVTGGTNGIGLAVTKRLCSLGLTVVAAGPQSLTEEASSTLRKYIDHGKLLYIPLHLDSFQSIENAITTFSAKFSSLDYLINNAGIMLTPYFETDEGFEGHMGVNFIGHVKLTRLLLPMLNKGSNPRVINVASSVYSIPPVSFLLGGRFLTNPPYYSSHLAYPLSKLAVVLYTECLADQLKILDCSIRVYSVHPGVVASSLYKHVCPPLKAIQYLFSPIFFRTVDQGCIPILNCALVKDIQYDNGSYVQNDIGSIVSGVSQTHRDKFWKMIGQCIYKSEAKKRQ